MRGSLPVNAVGLFIAKPFLDYEGASYAALKRAILFLTQAGCR